MIRREPMHVVETADGEAFFSRPRAVALGGSLYRLADGPVGTGENAEQDDELADPTWDFDYEPLDEEDESGLGDRLRLSPTIGTSIASRSFRPCTAAGPCLNDLSPTR